MGRGRDERGKDGRGKERRKEERRAEEKFVFILPVRRVQLLQEWQQFFSSKLLHVQLKPQQLSFMMQSNKLAESRSS